MAVFSGGNQPITGIVQQVSPTWPRVFTLRYSVGNVGCLFSQVPQLLVEVRNNATNALIASWMSSGDTPTNYVRTFTATGQTKIRFIDRTTDTQSCDVTLDNVSVQ